MVWISNSSNSSSSNSGRDWTNVNQDWVSSVSVDDDSIPDLPSNTEVHSLQSLPIQSECTVTVIRVAAVTVAGSEPASSKTKLLRSWFRIILSLLYPPIRKFIHFSLFLYKVKVSKFDWVRKPQYPMVKFCFLTKCSHLPLWTPK